MTTWPTTFLIGEFYANCDPVLTYLCSLINLMMTALKVDQSQTKCAIYQAHDHCSPLSVVCTMRCSPEARYCKRMGLARTDVTLLKRFNAAAVKRMSSDLGCCEKGGPLNRGLVPLEAQPL